MVMRKSSVIGLAVEGFPAFKRQKMFADAINLWTRGKQQLIPTPDQMPYDGYLLSQTEANRPFRYDGQLYMPREVNDEYLDLADRAPDPWARLIISSLAQTAYVDGVRRSDSSDNMEVWNDWQRNRWDAQQIALHRSVVGHGIAYGTAVLGNFPLMNTKAVKMTGRSATEMAAFYDEPSDEWPSYAIYAVPQPDTDATAQNWAVRLYDSDAIHFLSCTNDGLYERDWTYIQSITHPLHVPPVVKYCGSTDLEGYPMGEIEPVLPMLRRLDQDTFDRLVVQRFGAWKVRYVSGMAKPGTAQEQRAGSLAMRQEDLLISEDPDTKFGVLDSTDPSGFVALKDADLRCLSAVTQIPPHHLLGLSANLQAEALAAAEAGLQRKSNDFRTGVGEGHEQMFRLVAAINKNTAEANATDMQVRWRDTESRSLVQTANALSLLATQLNVPYEMLWEQIPGWTDQDSKRAKALVGSGALEQLLTAIAAQGNPTQQQGNPIQQQQGNPIQQTGGSDNIPANG